MSDDLKMEDIVEVVPTSETTEEVVETTTEQDPLKVELEKVQRTGRTELEKAEFSLKKNAERLAELGGNPSLILGIKEESIDDEDDEPVTKGDLKKMMLVGATKTAMQLADEIEDNTERELVRHYLENKIVPSGNPQDDLRDARRIANSIKNERIIQEISRKPETKTHSNASGVDAHQVREVVLTHDELIMMKPPFNLTKEEILKARGN